MVGRWHPYLKITEEERAAQDEWQSALTEASHRYSLALKELHETTPWPDAPVIADAINTLATELWDRWFGAAEVTSAFKDAVANLPRYSCGDEAGP